MNDSKKMAFRANFDHDIKKIKISPDYRIVWVMETEANTCTRFHAIDITSFTIQCVYKDSNIYTNFFVEEDHILAITEETDPEEGYLK